MRYLKASDVKLRKRSKISHKGENGKVLIVGGSVDYVGAVMLAALAAYRSGADWVEVVAPEKVAWAINTFSPDIITTKVKGNYFTAASARKVIELSKNFDVTLIGNGIGRRANTQQFAARTTRGIKGIKVIDADALTSIHLKDVSNAILTPHHSELEKLLRNSRISRKDLRKKIGNNVIVLKGEVDEIISKDKTVFNRTGNEGMTVGGTGDVLAGLAAGLLAQEKELFKAACAAAYVNGRAGDELLRQKGYGFLASELLGRIPSVLRRLRNG